MARVPFDKVIRTADGTPNPGAQVTFYWRDRLDIPLPVYTTETGATLATQPLTPDADGKITAWAPATSNFFSSFSVLVNHGGGAIQFFPWDPFPVRQDAWTALTLAGAWTNASGTAAYIKSAEGIVVVRGLVTGGAVSSTIATLPADARPSIDTNFPGVAGTTAISLAVSAAGVITAGPTATNTALDSITFQTNS